MSPISQTMRRSVQDSWNSENESILLSPETSSRTGRQPEVRRNRTRRGCQVSIATNYFSTFLKKTFVITRKSNDGDIFDIEDILKPKKNAAVPNSVEKEVVTPRCRSKSRERKLSSVKLCNGLSQFISISIILK